MKLTIEKTGDSNTTAKSRQIPTRISWEHAGKVVSLTFSDRIRAIAVDNLHRVYVSLYSAMQVHAYDFSGQVLGIYVLPQKSGYQFFGLNANEAAESGAALVYAPMEPELGNEWGDLEQYELLNQEPILGRFLGIYR